MEDFREFEIYDDYDFYDHDKLEKLNEARSKQWIRIYKRMITARGKGDEKALAKAREAMRKHEEKDAILKEKARQTGYCWC
jgi:hypothetical protein